MELIKISPIVRVTTLGMPKIITILVNIYMNRGKWPNKKKPCTFTFMSFLVGNFPRFNISFESSFLIKCCIIPNIFFFKFWSVLKKSKNGFPLYFQILIGRVPGFIFMLECKFFHQMPCINLHNNRGGAYNFKFGLLTFDPIIYIPYQET